jgi:hypothetical protein
MVISTYIDASVSTAGLSKSIFSKICFIFELLWIVFRTFTFFHAWAILGFSPHGPCIIWSATRTYPSGSSFGSGILADIHRSIMSGVISLPFLPIHCKIWTCGKPLFWNSIEYKIANVGPNVDPAINHVAVLEALYGKLAP